MGRCGCISPLGRECAELEGVFFLEDEMSGSTCSYPLCGRVKEGVYDGRECLLRFVSPPGCCVGPGAAWTSSRRLGLLSRSRKRAWEGRGHRPQPRTDLTWDVDGQIPGRVSPRRNVWVGTCVHSNPRPKPLRPPRG